MCFADGELRIGDVRNGGNVAVVGVAVTAGRDRVDPGQSQVAFDGFDELVHAAGPAHRTVLREAADVADGDALRGLASAAQEKFGQIDLLIHTVAVRPHAPYETLSLDDWTAVRSIILDSAFHLTQAVLPGVR